MRPSRRLLGELRVASLLIYPSRPQTEADRAAREAVWAGIKQGRPAHVQRIAIRLSELPPEHPVRQLVPSTAILIPVPRSTPLSANAMWPALEIAMALLTQGIGTQISPVLQRVEPVRRSTGARTILQREPPLRHFETIAASPLSSLPQATHFVLVDDVVTAGSTLIACASHLRQLAPHATITAFTAARADRNATLQQATDMFSPLVETIQLFSDDGRPWRS